MRNNKGFQYDAKYDPARKQTSKFAKFWYYEHKTAHRIFHAILFLLLLITQLVSVTINIVEGWTMFACIVVLFTLVVFFYEIAKDSTVTTSYYDIMFLVGVLVYQIYDIYLIVNALI